METTLLTLLISKISKKMNNTCSGDNVTNSLMTELSKNVTSLTVLSQLKTNGDK
jgi:hypothetical protein